MDSRCLNNNLLKLKKFQEFFKRHDTLLMYFHGVLTQNPRTSPRCIRTHTQPWWSMKGRPWTSAQNTETLGTLELGSHLEATCQSRIDPMRLKSTPHNQDLPQELPISQLLTDDDCGAVTVQ